MHSERELEIENGVLIGRERDLFLAGGNHSIVRFMQGAELPDRTVLALHDNITRRRALAEHYGARFFHLIAPEKYVVYPQNLPIADAGYMAKAYLQKGYNDAIYPVDLLREPRGGRSYYLTDTHWSVYGVLAAVELIARQCDFPGATVDPIISEVAAGIRTDERTFYGDLGRKLDPQQGEPRLVFGTAFHTRTYHNGLAHDYGIQFNDGRLIVVEGDAACSENVLLIFGDSYLFQALDLLGLFFRRVIFARTRFFHEELVAMARPTHVVSQMAERYMGRIYSDEVAPPFTMIAHLLGRTPSMELDHAQAIAQAFCGRRPFDATIFRQSAVPAAAAGSRALAAPSDVPQPAAQKARSVVDVASASAPAWLQPFSRLRQFLHPDVVAGFDSIVAGGEHDDPSELWRAIVPAITSGQDLMLARRWRFSDRRMLPVLLEEIFGHHEYFCATEAKNPRILDCGANCGLATYYFLRSYPSARIEAFEPNPALAELLSLNISRNNFDNVALRQVAIADRDGTRQFYVVKSEDPASSLIAGRHCGDIEEITVETVALSGLLDTPVALLKLDIEGTEAEALRSASWRLRNCETIICETHAVDGRNTLLDVLSILDEAGFDWAVTRSLWDERKERFRFARTIGNTRSYCVFARRREE
jgi:FkbM family methyltransferase